MTEYPISTQPSISLAVGSIMSVRKEEFIDYNGADHIWWPQSCQDVPLVSGVAPESALVRP